MAVFTSIVIGLMITQAVMQARAAKKAANAARDAGVHQHEAADSQASILDYNAKVTDLQAQDAIERGVESESRFRTQVRGAIGTQRANLAANNVDVGYGSAVDVQGDVAYLGELDALTIKTNAAREAWGFKVQGEDIRKRAAVTRKEGVYMEAAGRANASAANWQMAAGLVGSGATLLSMKYGYDRTSRS